MLVTRTNFDEVLKKISVPGVYALDTETTGLRPYNGDVPFSIIICDTDENAYYFNLIPYEDKDNEEIVLTRPHKRALGTLLKSKHHLWVAHNAKFDMHQLARLQMYPALIYCTMVQERVVQNDRISYSLANITGEKSDEVKKYVRKHKLFETAPQVFGHGVDKLLQYHRVPLDIMQPYAEQDTIATIRLYLSQQHRLEKMNRIRTEKAPRTPDIAQVCGSESAVLPVVFRMERKGMLVDREYAVEAYTYEKDRIAKASQEFKGLIGKDYDRREAFLGPIIENELKCKLGRTASKQFALDAEVLKALDHPLTDAILAIRDAEKRAYTFWAGILDRLDKQDRLHADFKQAGTATGRFSCSDPNLQNLPKRRDENATYPIRKAFIPPEDYCLYMPDFEQMEYRLFMDLAGQMDVIEAVLAGTDVHSATADMIGKDRSIAKMVNFLLIYGGGDAKLAEAIKVPLDAAKGIRENYLLRLPEVRKLIDRLKRTALMRGWLINWYGRPLRFTKDTYYRAPNYFIQGGCADIVKLGMVRCDGRLRRTKSYICSQIHDEVWFAIHRKELELAPVMNDLLATAYPHRHLPMATDAAYSWDSAHDKQSGFPGEVEE